MSEAINEMKRITFIFLMLFCVIAAEAQSTGSELVTRGIRVYQDGERLRRSDLSKLCDFDMRQYKSGRREAIAGLTVMSIGAIPCAVGLYGLIGGIAEALEDNPYPSGLGWMTFLYGGGTGLLLELIGIPTYLSGRKTIREATHSYNHRNIELSMNLCCNGIGLTISF